jgi:hypothetical protein
VKEELDMLDFMLAGGLAVAIVGVLQVASRKLTRAGSSIALLREGMGGLEGPDAEAFRAEFRLSGIALPERPRPAGFF